MKVGFGTYRISSRSKEHKEALKYAIESGCSFIDTSANYTDGESERLIGEVLEEISTDVTVITKAGYIQGENISRFLKLKEKHPEIEYVDHHEALKHSIDPLFLEDQITLSKKRLGIETLDSVLLHNPEYFLKNNPKDHDKYYERIKKAFKFLNDQVLNGSIKSFGVSCNTLVESEDHEEYTDLLKLWKAAEEAGATENFKYLQFPLNLVEMGAVRPRFDNLNLIQKAQSLGLITIGNRPLNAFTSSGLLRLAESEIDEEVIANSNKVYESAMENLNSKWALVRESEDDHLEELPLVNQISEIWDKQISKDAVEQIFYGHFFPLIAKIYGKDLTPEESSPYYDLFETAVENAKKNMNLRARSFMEQAEKAGLVNPSENTTAIRALEKYQETGIDIVLVGMRQKQYVKTLKAFF
mgnify:FL=1|tara:strand:- start:78 stop:1316 length:1239 start_codon:yes stop_codon:yes gene_type:complete